MKLSFRYQFILAPLVIVVILGVLVAYTLVELSKINRANSIVGEWEILSDRVQTSISSATHIRSMSLEFSAIQKIQDHELYFNYLEQMNVLADNLGNKSLQDNVPDDLVQLMKETEKLIRSPDEIDLIVLDNSLNNLLGKLNYQFKVFSAKRRTIFIDNHRQLVAITSRMTTILLSGLILCIILASGLTFLGLRIIRHRLIDLTQRAHEMCFTETKATTVPKVVNDELDELEICLANMTEKLVKIVSIKNVLRGAENERKRIAMDMHDSVLTDLTTINRSLDYSNNTPLSVDKIKVLRSDVDNVINSLRQTIDDLHPQVLETLGLESALRSFLDRQKEISGFPNLHFSFENEIEGILTLEVKLNIFRIIIEAINNVIKHANCDRLEINLRIVSEQLVITIEDNGAGMTNASNTTGHGCSNISERADLIGAKVHWINSRFSTGTCFELILLIKTNVSN